MELMLNVKEKTGDTNSSDNDTSAPKRATSNILSPGLTSALARTKISSRNATFVLSEVASSLGHDVSTLNSNRNPSQRARASNRITKSNSRNSSLTVHLDGKLLEGSTCLTWCETCWSFSSSYLRFRSWTVTGHSKTILRDRLSPRSRPVFERVE